MKKHLSLILLFFLFTNCLTAQRDTTFWLSVPYISDGFNAGYGYLDRPIVLHAASFSSAATVTVTQPANASFVPITVTVNANSSARIDLTAFIDSVENTIPDKILNRGLKISSTQPIQVYYEMGSPYNFEIFSLKGQAALGNDFFIPSQNLLTNNSAFIPNPFSSFDIVATTDSTMVTITPSNGIVGHSAGTAFTVVLNKGQTYSATASSNAGAQHLQGSRVISNKPVAITIKDDLMEAAPIYGQAQDLGADQIVPVTNLYTEYISIRSKLFSPYDKVFVLATQNNTLVKKNGTAVSTINAGTQIVLAMDSPAMYIQASAPVYVLQLAGMGKEVSIGLVPPIICEGSNEIAFQRILSTNNFSDTLFFGLTVRNGGQGSFLFNGNSGVINGSSFLPVPGTAGQWLYSLMAIPKTVLKQDSTAIISNSASLFHLSVTDGISNGGGAASFGYFSDFKNIAPVAAHADALQCSGTSVQLQNDSIPGATYLWTGPNNFSSSLREPVINNFSAADTGTYTLTVTAYGCTNSDTIHVALPTGGLFNINIGNDTTLCNGQLTLNASVSGGTSYVWNTGNTTQSITVHNSGIYIVTVTNAQQCVAVDSVIVTDTLPFTLTRINTSCGAANGSLTVNVQGNNAPYTYLWSNAQSTATISGLAGGTYNVTVRDGSGCSFTTTGIIDSTYTNGNVPLSGNPAVICSGDSAYICAPPAYTAYIWNTGDTTQCIYSGLAGNYYVTVTDNGNCTATSHGFNLSAYPLPPVSVTVNGDTLLGFNAVTYQWYFNGTPISGATSPVYIAPQPGLYQLLVSDTNGCYALSNPFEIVTGISDLYLTGVVSVYPNPFGDGGTNLSVSSLLIGAKIEILDYSGRLVYNSTIKETISKIDALAGKGIYLVNITSSAGIVYRLKLVRL